MADSVQPQLSDEVTINKDAGRWNFVFVTLRLESGEELPCMVDTGSPITVFDKSLESKLGMRLKTGTAWLGSTKQKCGVYATPKLYLGSTLLMTGSNSLTYDLKKAERHTTWAQHHSPYLAILGLDCMKHYCIQLDFQAEKMRFLDSDHVATTNLGNAFPLTFTGGHIYLQHSGLLGGSNTNALIDTGWLIEGQVEKGVIQGHDSGTVRLPEHVWGGETYTNLNVQVSGHANTIGLKFLARHLVTFDFPKQTIYLKQTSVGPLPDEK
jgi:hypothetical protein